MFGASRRNAPPAVPSLDIRPVKRLTGASSPQRSSRASARARAESRGEEDLIEADENDTLLSSSSKTVVEADIKASLPLQVILYYNAIYSGVTFFFLVFITAFKVNVSHPTHNI
eukprot:GILI01035428.1.p2 GENE.GILI01035428.1~~GILI01035428.1.p2  ORF type:complete len:126 (+),score=11.84 GILI01035428.1:38-379(+)